MFQLLVFSILKIKFDFPLLQKNSKYLLLSTTRREEKEKKIE